MLFLYAITFVGGFAVSRRLDGRQQTSWSTALAIDCALLTVFAVQPGRDRLPTTGTPSRAGQPPNRAEPRAQYNPVITRSDVSQEDV